MFQVFWEIGGQKHIFQAGQRLTDVKTPYCQSVVHDVKNRNNYWLDKDKGIRYNLAKSTQYDAVCAESGNGKHEEGQSCVYSCLHCYSCSRHVRW